MTQEDPLLEDYMYPGDVVGLRTDGIVVTFDLNPESPTLTYNETPGPTAVDSLVDYSPKAEYHLDADDSILDVFRGEQNEHGFDNLAELGEALQLADELSETTLTDPQAAVYAVREIYESNRSKTARLLGKSESTVDKQLRQARTKIQNAQSLVATLPKSPLMRVYPYTNVCQTDGIKIASDAYRAIAESKEAARAYVENAFRDDAENMEWTVIRDGTVICDVTLGDSEPGIDGVDDDFISILDARCKDGSVVLSVSFQGLIKT